MNVQCGMLEQPLTDQPPASLSNIMGHPLHYSVTAKGPFMAGTTPCLSPFKKEQTANLVPVATHCMGFAEFCLSSPENTLAPLPQKRLFQALLPFASRAPGRVLPSSSFQIEAASAKKVLSAERSPKISRGFSGHSVEGGLLACAGRDHFLTVTEWPILWQNDLRMLHNGEIQSVTSLIVIEEPVWLFVPIW